MSSRESLGLGLIGCGSFGQFCLEAYKAVQGVRAAAVADVRPQAAQALAEEFGVPALSSAQELIRRPEVDIVHIATPPSSHYELAMTAIGAGKHVLCEKPLATDPAHAKEMIAAAAKANVICPVNFIMRYNPTAMAVKEVLETGVMGSPLAVRLTNCAGDSVLSPEHWFWDRDISGGIFVEHGVHFFDLYSWWMGSGQVQAAHAEMREGADLQDRVQCLIRHDCGAMADHYHGFDQVSLMDRTHHLLVCEMGEIAIEGWIPLELTIDAAVDQAGAEALAAALPGADIQTVADYGAEPVEVMGRGLARKVSKRLRIRACPQPDKQALYAQNLRDLLADQIAHIHDRTHERRVVEANGLASLELAAAARTMANR